MLVINYHKIEMKHINITFTEEEYEKLIKTKDGTSWHDFILKLTKGGSDGKENSS